MHHYRPNSPAKRRVVWIGRIACAVALPLVMSVTVACGGGGGNSGDSTATSSSGGKTYAEAQARAILDAASLTPKDLTGAEWVIASDVTQDNAAIKDATIAASNERCGRLLGRTVTNQPKDMVLSFLGGDAVTKFSNITVYATEAGAADCAAEAATRFAQPGELARAFGPTFINPLAADVASIDYPSVADGSFAATLTGQVNAAGTVVDITILVVGFRKGNVSAVVGTAHRAGAIPTSEVSPLVDLVLRRISENQ